MHHRISDSEKLDIIKRYQNGESSISISKSIGFSKYAILQVLRNNNIKRRSCRKYDDITPQIISLYESGTSAPEIQKIYGITSTNIYKKLKENNIHIRTSGESIRKYNINEHFFDLIDNEETSYFLGLLFADGHVSSTKYNNKIVISLQESDYNILNKMKDLICNDKQLQFIECNVANKKWSNMYCLSLDSIYMANLLKSYGLVSPKTYNRFFPDVITNSNEDIIRHFIRGYFDGDGTIYYKIVNDSIVKSTVRISIASNYNICKSIGDLINLYCNANYIISKNGNSFHIVFMGRLKSIRILNWMYKDSNYYIDRKLEKYLKLKEIL